MGTILERQGRTTSESRQTLIDGCLLQTGHRGHGELQPKSAPERRAGAIEDNVPFAGNGSIRQWTLRTREETQRHTSHDRGPPTGRTDTSSPHRVGSHPFEPTHVHKY